MIMKILNQKSFFKPLKYFWSGLCYVLEIPLYVKEEYNRLIAEIKELEKLNVKTN